MPFFRKVRNWPYLSIIILAVIEEVHNTFIWNVWTPSFASYIIYRSPVGESYHISCLVKPSHFLPPITPPPGYLQIIGHLFLVYIYRKKLREPVQHSPHHTNHAMKPGQQSRRAVLQVIWSEKGPRFSTVCLSCTLFPWKLNPKLAEMLASKSWSWEQQKHGNSPRSFLTLNFNDYWSRVVLLHMANVCVCTWLPVYMCIHQ